MNAICSLVCPELCSSSSALSSKTESLGGHIGGVVLRGPPDYVNPVVPELDQAIATDLDRQRTVQSHQQASLAELCKPAMCPDVLTVCEKECKLWLYTCALETVNALQCCYPTLQQYMSATLQFKHSMLVSLQCQLSAEPSATHAHGL